MTSGRRRTEHCWPVAHSLADLQDVIPDPSSFDAGSVFRIDRIMLPDVHLQLVKAIADRFCPVKGWQTVYLVHNKYRAEEVEDGAGTAVVGAAQKAPQALQLINELAETGSRILVLSELRFEIDLSNEVTILLPLPVTSVKPVFCEVCKELQFFMHQCRTGALFIKCPVDKKQKRMSICSKRKSPGVKRRSPLKLWTKEESDLAVHLYKQGMTCREIGKSLGRTREAVKRYRDIGGYEGILTRQRNREQIKTLEAAMDDMAI